MFGDIGISELLVVLVVAIVVTRPEDLPVLMRRFGVFYAYVQSFVQGIWFGWQEKLGLFSTSNPSHTGERRKSDGGDGA